MNPVQELRNRGFRVRVTHRRRYNTWNEATRCCSVVELARFESPGLQFALPHGGSTEVELTTPAGETLKETVVCSKNDQFVKSMGVKIALGRITKSL